MRRNRNKKNLYGILIIFLLGLGVGYAALTTNLSINGTAHVDNATWNVYWDNVQVTEGSVTAPTPTISNQTTVSYEITLHQPGDYYEFTVDAVNAGSIDAMVSGVTSYLNGSAIATLPDYIEYSVTYDDGRNIYTKQKLASGSTETYKVHIEFKTDVTASQLPSTDQTLSFAFSVQYEQADDTAQTRLLYHVTPVQFNEDPYTTEVEPSSGEYLIISQGNGTIVRIDYMASIYSNSVERRFLLIGYDSGEHYQQNQKTIREMCDYASGNITYPEGYTYCGISVTEFYSVGEQGLIRAKTFGTDCIIRTDGSYNCEGLIDD